MIENIDSITFYKVTSLKTQCSFCALNVTFYSCKFLKNYLVNNFGKCVKKKLDLTVKYFENHVHLESREENRTHLIPPKKTCLSL